MNYAWVIIIYIFIGLGMVIRDFSASNPLQDAPRFIQDRSISTAIKFILLWPYKLLKKW